MMQLGRWYLRVDDGADYFRTTLAVMAAIGPMRERAAAVNFILPPMTEVADVPPLFTRLNHNRWIVDCPDCSSAEYAYRREPLMMCQGCWNGGVGNKWRRVRFPLAWQDIERIVMVRPNLENRNWEPGETLAQLRAENREHGLLEEIEN